MTRRTLLACGIAVLAAVGGLCADAAGILDRAERDTVDFRFVARGDHAPPDVAVVGIDDVTFGVLRRRWPFRRTLHARAVTALHDAGVRQIVYDVQFTEPSGPPHQSDDLALYDALAEAPGSILATSEVGPGGSTNVLGGDRNLAAIGVRAAAGHLPKDGRGVVRRFTRSVDGLDTLAVASAESVLGHALPAGVVPEEGALIDFRGGPGTIRHLSFSDVIAPGWVPPGWLRGAVVVVGATSPSLQDMHLVPTSQGNPMSGPEVQANAIWTALHGAPLRAAPDWFDILSVVLLGIAAPLATLRFRFGTVAIATAVVGAGFAAASLVAFRAGVVMELIEPLAALFAGLLGIGIVGYLTETRERRRIALVNAVLDEKVRERTAELRATQLEVVQRLSQASESRDNETGRHIERMSRVAEALALATGMAVDDAEELRHAAVLHDIGKLGVPDYVLLKEGRLTDEEREIMKTHTIEGAGILAGSSSPLLRLGEVIARTHHEHWDGGGYPRGIAGEEIPLPGRICAIADVFDALVSVRRYKAGWPLERALAEFRAQRGRQFDPLLVDAFLTIAPGLYDELDYARDPQAEEARVPA